MTLTRIIYTLAIFILSEVLYRLLKGTVNSTLTRLSSQRARTAGSVIKSLFRYLTWALAIIYILSVWGVNTGPLLTGAGIIGVAIAFGSQSLVKDVIMGLFAIMDNYFKVGDEVEVAGKKGKVISVKLRSLVIRDGKTGDIHIIPHSLVGVITKMQKKN
jgi:moderate conductance mechanosensitive channel